MNRHTIWVDFLHLEKNFLFRPYWIWLTDWLTDRQTCLYNDDFLTLDWFSWPFDHFNIFYALSLKLQTWLSPHVFSWNSNSIFLTTCQPVWFLVHTTAYNLFLCPMTNYNLKVFKTAFPLWKIIHIQYSITASIFITFHLTHTLSTYNQQIKYKHNYLITVINVLVNLYAV